ncbi:TRAP transporter small permease [Roseovarius sp. S4756]|uniref:TRAP transporter small permease n=1 Tax=Roseovarius maritimus TaxID=3342637 RepID=UPI00372C917C
MNDHAIIRFEALVVQLVGILLGISLIAMVVVNVVNAVGRYSGWYSFVGADELLVYGMIWIVMLGSILAARNRDHLSVNLLPTVVKGRLAAALQVVIDVVTVAVAAFIAWHSLSFIERIAMLNQKSMGLGVPMVIPHSAIFVGFAGIAAVTAFLTVVDIIRLTQSERGRT